MANVAGTGGAGGSKYDQQPSVAKITPATRSGVGGAPRAKGSALPFLANAALGLVGTNTKNVSYAFQHPVARLQNKGPFTVKNKQVMGDNDFPFFGGPEKDLANAAENVAKDVAPKVNYTSKGVTRAAKGQSTIGPKTLQQTATDALQGAKQTRTAQEVLRSGERAKRIREYTKASQANPTAAGHREASRLLAGKYPKLDWANFQQFSPETIDQLHKYIVDHPDLQGFEVKRARDAIDKAYAGTAPTKNEEKLLRKAFGVPATNQIMKSTSKFHLAKSLLYDIGNIPRSVMASYDASGLLRQELLMATGHPGIWAKSIPTYLKAIKSEDFYNEGLARLHNRENALNGVYDRMGVDLTELSPRGNAAAREESFRSPLAEKIPGVRMSGRGFTLALDKARADLADHLYAKAQAAGKADNEHTLQSIGDVVNSMTGRGDLGNGPIGRSQEGLNLLLFSPRLIKSRIDFLNPVWYARLDPIARHQAYRAMGGLAVLMTTVLEIGHAAGAQVNLDPRSSDFAKVKIGNTRLDFAGGFQQYIHLLSEIATQRKVTSSGKVTKLDVQEGPGKTTDWDVLFSFMRSKLAPIASSGVDLSQRQNVVGQPLSVSNSVVSRLTPLAGQDAVSVGQDVAKHHGTFAGAGAGALAGLLSAFGGGVQNYQPKQPKNKSKNPYAGGSSSGGSVYDQAGSGGGGSSYNQP